MLFIFVHKKELKMPINLRFMNIVREHYIHFMNQLKIILMFNNFPGNDNDEQMKSVRRFMVCMELFC